MAKLECRVIEGNTVECRSWLGTIYGGYWKRTYNEVVQDAKVIRVRLKDKWGMLPYCGGGSLPVAYDEIRPAGDMCRYLCRKGFQAQFYNENAKLLFTEILGNYTVEQIFPERGLAIVRQLCRELRFALVSVSDGKLLSSWGNEYTALADGFLLRSLDLLPQQCLFVSSGGWKVVDYFQEQGGRYQILNMGGFWTVCENGKEIFCKACKKLWLIDAGYRDCFLIVVQCGGMVGLYDMAGQQLLKCQYERIERIGRRAEKEVFLVKQGTASYVVSAGDSKVINFPTRTVRPCPSGYIFSDDKYREGYAADDGMIVLPAEYQHLELYAEMKLIKVCKDGRCGVCDFTGRFLVPVEYEEECITVYRQGVVVRMVNGYMGFFNLQGNKFVFYCDNVEPISKFGHEVLLVKMNSAVGLRGLDGSQLVPCRYRAVEICRDGYRGIDFF